MLTNAADEFREKLAYRDLIWGIRCIIFSPVAIVQLMILDSNDPMPLGGWIFLLGSYYVASIVWWLKGVRGLRRYEKRSFEGGEFGENRREFRIVIARMVAKDTVNPRFWR